MAGEESFELSIEVLQAFEFKRFRDITILCSGAFSPDHIEIGLFHEVSQGKDQKFHCTMGIRIGEAPPMTIGLQFN